MRQLFGGVRDEPAAWSALLDRLFPTFSRVGLFLLALAAVLLLALVDTWTGPNVSLSLFYFAPIALVTWRVGRASGIVLAGIVVTVGTLADRLGGLDTSFLLFWNGVVRLGFFLVTVWLMAELRTALRFTKAQALTDTLTGLANTRHFSLRSEQSLAQARRTDVPLTIVYLDLDNFKEVNDRHGHGEGDKVLRLVAGTLRELVREMDTVARLGGDEFAVLLPATEPLAVKPLLERLKRKLGEEMRELGHPVTFSLGACTFLNPPASVDDMVRAADELMYDTKRFGKDQVQHRLVGWKD